MVFKKKDISTPPPDISPRETGIFKSKKKTRFQRGNSGNAQLRKMGYQGKRAPDRPWAFRRGIPPSVVYRGAPRELGLASPNPGFPLLFLFSRTFPSGEHVLAPNPPARASQAHFPGAKPLQTQYLGPPDPLQRRFKPLDRSFFGPDLVQMTLCARQIIFGKIHPLETAFPFGFAWDLRTSSDKPFHRTPYLSEAYSASVNPGKPIYSREGDYKE